MKRESFVEKELQRYQEKWLLTAWEIEWEFVTSMEPWDGDIDWESQAVVTDVGLRQAHLRLPAKGSRKELSNTIEHEMLHLVLAPINRVIDPLIEAKIPKKARAVFFETLNRALNETIGHLQRANPK